MQRQTQDPIKHQDIELFAKTFDGINPVNTFAKFSASGVSDRVLKFSEKHLMILNT